MPGPGKRYRADLKKVEKKPYPIPEAVQKIKTFAATKFDQSVDLCLHLGIDPKQADQAIRGSVALPHGTGKNKRVIAFCAADKVAAAKAAGAIEAGSDDLVKKIEDGWLDFDVAIASPDMMRFVGKLGKQLGPKGLMPSPKAGTVTPNIAQAVTEFVAGKVSFKNDAGGNVHVPVGRLSFNADKLEANVRHMLEVILKMKPASVKGQYIKKISLSGTMTPGVLLENVV